MMPLVQVLASLFPGPQYDGTMPQPAVDPAIRYFPTGSRVFGDATPDSDYDWVILAPALDFFPKLEPFGFVICHDAYTDDDHLIVRRESDRLNLIFTNSEKKFEMWMRSTEASKALCLTKDQRKVLFHMMIDIE